MKQVLKNKLRPLRNAIQIYVNHYNNQIYLDWYFKHSRYLKKFKNIHQGEGCFIIGNGPSLNQTNLEALKNYHTFGLNKIYLMQDKVNLNLSYHACVNPYVIEQSAEHFRSLNCPSFLSYKASLGKILPNENIYFILTGGSYTFHKDLLKPICEGHTVTYVAMQIAFYMGFSKIFLIGVDHNFKSVGKPNELQTLEGDDPNHFDPNYFSNKQWQLPDLEASELSYTLARFFYTRNGRQIYDATVGGKLDIFPKISFEKALELCPQKMN